MMLFDERDMMLFDSDESRSYFKEILQLYYGQNYRATIVMLHSFVIYDLYNKLQIMANEGDKKAKNKLKEINAMIEDDSKYSIVEREVIEFYKVNCPMYFDKFIEDIEYLRNCRNKCAHLKVDDNSLFVPNDYHARMLICSMFDNVLSVKAPFITDLFSIAEADVEKYASQVSYIAKEGLDEEINLEIKNKYLKRMTYDSLKKSYKTFIKLLFISISDECEQNIYGLYAFVYAITDYLVKNGLTQLLQEEEIVNSFSRIKVETLKENETRRNALISLMLKYVSILDSIRTNNEVFEYISDCVLTNPKGVGYYKVFFPRSSKTAFEFFMENDSVKQPYHTEAILNSLKEFEDFDIELFMVAMINAIPTYNGFDDANAYMSSFKKHINEMSVECVTDIMDVYNSNSQCKNRTRHTSDIEFIQEYLKSQESSEVEDVSENDIPF